jgi:hypothetical protein
VGHAPSPSPGGTPVVVTEPSRSTVTSNGSPDTRRPATRSAPTGDGVIGATVRVPPGTSARTPTSAATATTAAAADQAWGRYFVRGANEGSVKG